MSSNIIASIGAKLKSRWYTQSGYREVIAMAGPLVLSTSILTIKDTTNRVFLTWYSPDALAASLPAGCISFTIICFFIGIAAYVNTFVAQYHGSKQSDRVAACTWQGIYFSLFAGLLIIPFALLGKTLFTAAGHDAKLIDLEATYFTILTAGGGFSILVSAIASFYTGLGRTWTVMWINIASAILNLILDYCLIFGNYGFPEMGIAGAGWATIFTQFLSAVIFFTLFVFGPHRHEYKVWASRNLDWQLLKRLLRFGAPNGAQFMLDMLGWSLFVLLVGRIGKSELAATNLAFQINGIVFMPMIGFATATSTIVGQRLGENNPNLAARATWSAMHLTFIYMASIAAMYVLLPGPFIAPFAAKADPVEFALIRPMAIIMLRYVAIYSLFDGVNLIFSAALKGAGDTFFVMFMTTSMSMCLMVIPTWLTLQTGIGTIWTSWTFITIFISLLAFCFIARFLNGKWRHMRVIEQHHIPLGTTYAKPDTPMADAEIS